MNVEFYTGVDERLLVPLDRLPLERGDDADMRESVP